MSGQEVLCWLVIALILRVLYVALLRHYGRKG